MTYGEATHLGRAITTCVNRCAKSSEPYWELSEFISALRKGGVAEHYVQAINNAVLREIACLMTARAGGPSADAPVGGEHSPMGQRGLPANCYVLQ
jgi:hypothetical protein